MTRKKGQTVNERREKLKKEKEERIKAREQQKHKKNNEEKEKIRVMKQELEKQQLEKQQKFKEYLQNKNTQNKKSHTETKNSPEIPPTPNVSPEIPPTPLHCPSESPKQNKSKISLVSQMDKFFIEPVSKQKIKETRKDIPISMLPKITNAWKQGPPSIKKEFDLRVFITVSRNDTNRTETEDLREQACLPREVPTAKATPLINKTSEEEKNKLRTEGFNTIKDPRKMQEILYKTVFCKYGDKCNREKRGMKCNFYHNEDERRIPECPFKSVCKKHSKGYCKMFHPGQTDWIIKNPLPANCPVAVKKSVTTQKREISNLVPQIGGALVEKPSKVVYENRNELKIEIPVMKKVTIQSSLFNENKFLFYTQIEKAMKQGMEVFIKND